MARITVEDCLNKVDNRFKLIHMAAKRVRHLRKGAAPLVDSKNTDIVVSLREIAAGAVYESDESMDHLLLGDTHETSLAADTDEKALLEVADEAAEESKEEKKAD